MSKLESTNLEAAPVEPRVQGDVGQAGVGHIASCPVVGTQDHAEILTCDFFNGKASLLPEGPSLKPSDSAVSA